jgi:hypothetical protein
MRLLFFSVFLCLTACSNSPLNIRTITYRYDDASLAYRYQRNYTITITASSIKTSVDSHGRILAQSEEKFTTEKFTRLREETAHIFNRYSGKSEECQGGTALSITAADSSGKSKSLRWNCVAPPQPVNDFKAKIIALVPNLGSMLATPYPGYEDKGK